MTTYQIRADPPRLSALETSLQNERRALKLRLAWIESVIGATACELPEEKLQRQIDELKIEVERLRMKVNAR